MVQMITLIEGRRGKYRSTEYQEERADNYRTISTATNGYKISTNVKMIQS